MFQMTPSARFLGTLKSPWGPKDCEMTLLRSLNLLGETNAAREDPQ